ncbi:hypothetical protein [Pseudoalteromonas sp. SR43-3]|uniref:hypothetical protein n=1 Tax=Pseudoalteromonas sp. SR43-3 TaxID=2760943 RepID=UPI0015FF9CF9|nr:hypothetical protein [Pseudoalteromonas sp. SR43-3]MBB1275177.1 hypothetical protein [Pseudoalteromonas sp. SR43-3]
MSKQHKIKSNAKHRALIVKLKKIKKKPSIVIMKESIFSSLKASFSNSTVIFIGALVSTLITLFSYEKQVWTGLITYVIASALLFLALGIAWYKPLSKVFNAINIFISSLLSVIASLDLMKIISNLILFNKYGETPLNKVPSIFIDSATFSNPYSALFFSILTVFYFMFFYSLSTTYFKEKHLHKHELLLKEKHVGRN